MVCWCGVGYVCEFVGLDMCVNLCVWTVPVFVFRCMGKCMFVTVFFVM